MLLQRGARQEHPASAIVERVEPLLPIEQHLDLAPASPLTSRRSAKEDGGRRATGRVLEQLGEYARRLPRTTSGQRLARKGKGRVQRCRSDITGIRHCHRSRTGSADRCQPEPQMNKMSHSEVTSFEDSTLVVVCKCRAAVNLP